MLARGKREKKALNPWPMDRRGVSPPGRNLFPANAGGPGSYRKGLTKQRGEGKSLVYGKAHTGEK